MAQPDVLIVGGGIIGLALARELAGRGATVEVVDRGVPGAAPPAEAASFAAAGMLAPLAEAPLAAVPRPSPFFTACRDARDLWRTWAPELEAESGIAVDYDTSGAIVLDRGDGTRERLVAAADALGEPAEELPRERLAELLPGLAPDVTRALLLPGEHRVDNRLVCRALRRAVDVRGVRVTSGVTVWRVGVDGDRGFAEGADWRRQAAAVVVAAGAWSATIEGLPPLPLRPVHGQVLELAGVRWPWQGTVRGRELYAVRRRGDRLVVGATAEDRGFDVAPTDAGTDLLAAFVDGLFPGIGEGKPTRTWAGLRPGSGDDLPVLGPWPRPPIWAAGGHYRNGILLAPWTARALAGDLLDGAAGDLLRPFAPARFGVAPPAAGA